MNLSRTGKTIYSLFFLTSLLNPFFYALPATQIKGIFDRGLSNSRKKFFLKKEYSPINNIFEKNVLSFFDNNPKLVLSEPIKNKRELCKRYSRKRV